MTYLRRLPKFEYVGPRSLAELCGEVAATDAGEAMLLAGGTDALLQLRRRERTPRRVIGLKGVAELDFVREAADGSLAIGAAATLAALAAAPVVQRRYGVLAETVAQIGGPELRNVATVGGNVAGALPCADLPPALMTLGARVKLSRAGGERWLPLEDFFPEFGRTAAADKELVSEIGVPPPPPRSAGVYLKFHDRHAMDMTVVGVGAFVTLERDGGAIEELRLALAGSAPTIFRARRAEALLRGQAPADDALDAAAEAACSEAAPRSSWRANREYRTVLIRSLTKRAIRRACEKAGRREGVAR